MVEPNRPPLPESFHYDASEPLDIEVVHRARRDGADVTEIRYANGTGGEAAAFVVEPLQEPRRSRPGVVIAHGGTEGGKHLFVDQAVELTRRDVTVLLPDTSFPRFGDAEADAQAFRAAVLVQRRGLDVLASSYGTSSLGFFGHSSGGTQGAILSAVEPRLDAIVLGASGTGLVRWAMSEGLSNPSYLKLLERFEPIHYVGEPGGRRRLLFQHGVHDDVVSRESGKHLFDAAAGPKEWLEYECGHGVDGDLRARDDRCSFFERTLGKGAA